MSQKVLPFSALLYNMDKIETMTDIVTPPYDVITSAMQQEFYDRHPYNFCRLDFPIEEGDARYELVEKLYKTWREEKVLLQDSAPAIYVHHHTFQHPDGGKIIRKGFLASCRIQDYNEGGVKPHEKTLDAPKADRLRMTRATESNLSPVFSLYDDPQHGVTKRLQRLVQTTPFLDFVTHENERHQVWRLKDPQDIDFISQQLQDKSFFIADGHHRYETALNYRNEVLAKHPHLSDHAAARYLLMYFSNLADEGLVILPIHRALHSLSSFDWSVLKERLAEIGELTELHDQTAGAVTRILAEAGHSGHAFGLFPRGESPVIFTVKPSTWLQQPIVEQVPQALRELDVTVLHRLIFDQLLGLSEESQARQENIVYWKSTEKALQEVESGHCQLTVLLNPTRIAQMQSVAGAGLKMPQKSTYFFPKIVSGLLIHDVSIKAVDGIL